jgi:hypothetical protein
MSSGIVRRAFSVNSGISAPDYLLRVLSNERGQFAVAGHWKTQDLADQFGLAVRGLQERERFARATLGGVIDAFKHREEYALHLEQLESEEISAEEFADIENRLAVTPRLMSREALLEEIELLFDSTTYDFTASEVAELLRVCDDDVRAAIASRGDQIAALVDRE